MPELVKPARVKKGSPVKIRHGARHCDGELCGNKSLKRTSGRRRKR
ncbi:hypothetical protein B4113_3989 [Geobacillus sp. B4113_201601]|nr:hypothetical protein B4113_3989 [Geobacillus sp. B4113_201601]